MSTSNLNLKTMSDIRKIETYLESNGWTRDAAGAADFSAAVAAIKAADEGRLGLLVSGGCGVGKTALVKIVAPAFGHHRFIDLSDREEAEKMSDEWQELWGENLHEENVVLDDVGAELPANEFGIRLEPVAVFIAARHSRCLGRSPFPRLFVTTNLTAAEMDARYGGRTYSRLKDLCVPLKLTGNDKREWRKS